jgi:hypothetical protein
LGDWRAIWVDANVGPVSQSATWHGPRPLNVSGRWIVSRIGLAVVLAANAVLMIYAWQGLLFGPTPPPDWQGLVLAAERVARGMDPFVAQELAYRWSPLAAWVMIPFAASGLLVWQVLHLAVLALLPRRLILASLACFALWVDVAMGNVIVFGFVLAYLALTGRRSGVFAFTIFALLVPRPLYIPILLWLWLRQPDSRGLMFGTAIALAVLTLATGYASSWIDVLASSGSDITNATNVAPSRLIGYAWVPFGILGAAWAFRRGWIGLACVLASPYWLPYYFLMGLLDLREREPASPRSDSPEAPGERLHHVGISVASDRPARQT